MYSNSIIDVIDKSNHAASRLYRDACFNQNGVYIKNLDRLGRDLSQTIIVDDSPFAYCQNPDNAIPVKSWFSGKHDSELLDLIPILDALIDVGDVRLVIQKILNKINNDYGLGFTQFQNAPSLPNAGKQSKIHHRIIGNYIESEQKLEQIGEGPAPEEIRAQIMNIDQHDMEEEEAPENVDDNPEDKEIDIEEITQQNILFFTYWNKQQASNKPEEHKEIEKSTVQEGKIVEETKDEVGEVQENENSNQSEHTQSIEVSFEEELYHNLDEPTITESSKSSASYNFEDDENVNQKTGTELRNFFLLNF